LRVLRSIRLQLDVVASRCVAAPFPDRIATQTRRAAVNESVTMLPLALVASRPWLLAFAFSVEMPARQLWLSPMSPPGMAKNDDMPAPLRRCRCRIAEAAAELAAELEVLIDDNPLAYQALLGRSTTTTACK